MKHEAWAPQSPPKATLKTERWKGHWRQNYGFSGSVLRHSSNVILHVHRRKRSSCCWPSRAPTEINQNSFQTGSYSWTSTIKNKIKNTLLLGKKICKYLQLQIECIYAWSFDIQNVKYKVFWNSCLNIIILFLQLFYQVKGDMCLKIIENGKQKDVVIREGEVKQSCFPVTVEHTHVKWIFDEAFKNQFIPAVQASESWTQYSRFHAINSKTTIHCV